MILCRMPASAPGCGKLFCQSVAGGLLFFSIMKAYGMAFNDINLTAMSDKVFPFLSYSQISLMAVTVEMISALYLIFGNSEIKKYLIILWLSTVLFLYNLAHHYLAPNEPCHCGSGKIAAINGAWLEVLLSKSFLIYMLVGSMFFLGKYMINKKIIELRNSMALTPANLELMAKESQGDLRKKNDKNS